MIFIIWKRICLHRHDTHRIGLFFCIFPGCSTSVLQYSCRRFEERTPCRRDKEKKLLSVLGLIFLFIFSVETRAKRNSKIHLPEGKVESATFFLPLLQWKIPIRFPRIRFSFRTAWGAPIDEYLFNDPRQRPLSRQRSNTGAVQNSTDCCIRCC